MSGRHVRLVSIERTGLALTALASIAALFAASELAAQPTETRASEFSPVFDRFAVSLNVPRIEVSSQHRESQVSDAVQAVMGVNWKIVASSPEHSEFEIALDPRLESAQTAAPLSRGSAWEKAYQLEDHPSIDDAEPIFLTPVDPAEESGPANCTPSTASPTEGRLGEDQGINDPEWSLGPKGANVFEAWKLFEARGREAGAGILIGHPDTGYRRHPEIFSDAPEGPLLPHEGWDFVGNKQDPFDDLDEGILRWPGHGTKTASVIVSPRGPQSRIAQKWVTGVAPGARLVPLRVARGVVLLDMGKLADAIRSASDGKGPIVPRKVDVISISLGGVPSRKLRAAIRFAEKSNVIVVAAAGNKVKTVVWPARYDGVVAVAASNIGSKTWRHSSRGRRVAATAPGESVWCASTERAEGALLDCLITSSGTSYATAMTAGAAALWLSYHQSSPKLEALRQRKALAWGFREALKKGYRTVGNWESGYGPGILDAKKLLLAEVPDPPAALFESGASVCEEDLEALHSLFEEAPAPNDRLERFLGGARGQPVCPLAQVADEVAFLYATDPEVRRRIDDIAGPGNSGPRQFERARKALLSRDISPRLRKILDRAQERGKQG